MKRNINPLKNFKTKDEYKKDVYVEIDLRAYEEGWD